MIDAGRRLLGSDGQDIKLLHSFLLQLFTARSELLQQSKWNCPVNCFFAVFSLRLNKGFRSATDITPHLAKMKYAIKLVAFAEAVYHQHECGDNFLASAHLQGKRILDTQPVNTYSMLCALDSYASSAALTSSRMPNVTWDEKYTHVSSGDILLSMDMLRSGIQSALKDVGTALDKLQHGHHLDFLPDRTLPDDMSNVSYSYSFIDNAHTKNTHALLETLMNDPLCEFQVACALPDGTAVLNEAAIHKWLLEASNVQSCLACLIHVLGGQPPRGTEASDCRIRNRERSRNIMKCHGETVVVYKYTKTTNNTNHDQFLPHQLPGILSKLLDQYLILIRPMETILAGMLFGTEASALYQEYLMVKLDRKVESPEFCVNFQQFTRSYFKQEIKISTWRHIAVAIKREFIPEFYYHNFTGGSDIGDYQGGHSSSTAKRLYGVSTKGISYLNTQVLYYCSQFSRQWHNVMGVGRRVPLPLFKRSPYEHATTLYTTESPMTDREVESHKNLVRTSGSSLQTREEMQEMMDVFREQIRADIAGAMRTMEADAQGSINDGIVRGLKIFSEGQMSGSEEHNTTQAEISWRLASTSPSNLSGPALDKPSTKTPLDSDVIEGPGSSTAEKAGGQMLRKMCLTYKKSEGEMQWKSDGQRRLVCSTASKDRNIVGCIPTGGGKSASFEVPASTDDRENVTVIVAPFRALVNQICTGFLDRRVTCEEWVSKESSRTPPPTVIVILSDKCADDHFKG